MQVIEAKNSRLRDFRDTFGKMEAFIAGGAILSNTTKTQIADFDIYPKSRHAAAEVCLDLIENNNCFVVSITDRAVTFKSNDITSDDGTRAIIQVMIFSEFTDPKKIFDYFDFTVCMAAQDLESGEFTFHDDFWADVAAKNLRFNPGTRYPLNSMLRVSKYRSKGYHISKSEHVKIALAVAKGGMPESWEELENMIGGTYGKTLRLSREEEEFTFENAVAILSDIDISNCLHDASEVDSKIPNDILAEYVEYGCVKFANYHKSKYHITSDGRTNKMAIARDGCVLGIVNSHCDPIADHFIECEDDQDIHFYVLAHEEDIQGDDYVGHFHDTKPLGYRYDNKKIYRVSGPVGVFRFGVPADDRQFSEWGVETLVTVDLTRAKIVSIEK
jgi:hypothetical protein